MSDSTPAREPASITVTRKVEWVDTDASGHWHNTAVVKLCEMAESALLESLDLAGLFYSNGAPRVRMEAEFADSARFGDVVDIRCAVADVGRSKIVFAQEVTSDGQVLATLLVTAVLIGDNGRPKSIGADVRRLLLEGGPQEAVG